MDQRQLEKERIRLTREISMLEAQLSSAQRGKEEKLEENKTIREEIARLEEENKGLEDETHRLDEEIAKLDEEFKQAQLDAGRLRREIKVSQERTDNENKQSSGLRSQITRLENQLADLQRQVKREIEDRRTLEAKLRKTNAQIDAMKSHKLASFVTKRLEKQDWYKRQEEPMPGYDEVGEGLTAEGDAQATVIEEVQASEMPAKEEAPKADGKSDGGIDFGSD
jgi:chromosome segregation ATPase